MCYVWGIVRNISPRFALLYNGRRSGGDGRWTSDGISHESLIHIP